MTAAQSLPRVWRRNFKPPPTPRRRTAFRPPPRPPGAGMGTGPPALTSDAPSAAQGGPDRSTSFSGAP
eukprot:9506019-Lingulodinium_polyedra.AAC.1